MNGRRTGSTITAVGGVLLIAGSVLPWLSLQRFRPPESIIFRGNRHTGGGFTRVWEGFALGAHIAASDVVVVIAGAVVLGVGLYGLITRMPTVWLPAAPIVAGLVGLVASLFAAFEVIAFTFARPATLGYGLYVAIAGGAVCIAAGVIMQVSDSRPAVEGPGGVLDTS